MWSNIVQWINSHGGYVHPLLRFDPKPRLVYLAENDGEDDFDHDGTSELSSSSIVSAGTVVLIIPDDCILSLYSVVQCSFGKSLFSAVHHHVQRNRGLYNDEKDVILALFLAFLEHNHRRRDGDNYHCDLCLSPSDRRVVSFYQPYIATLPLSDVEVNQSEHDDRSDRTSSSSLQLLPRQWTNDQINRRLLGTSLHSRILREKKEIKSDYYAVLDAWRKTRLHDSNQHDDEEHSNQSRDKMSSESIFPPYCKFDDMMAMISSRGFAKLGARAEAKTDDDDFVDAMVPILDLLNHHRGKNYVNDEGRVSAVTNGADVRYGRYHDDNNERNENDPYEYDAHLDHSCGDKRSNKNTNDLTSLSSMKQRKVMTHSSVSLSDRDDSKVVPSMPPTTKHILARSIGTNTKNSSVQGGVKVTAAKCLKKGTSIEMTYGAKGNAVLLARYGFCLENNVEPDGSSNDILELYHNPNALPIQLQRGPKSYSYGPFIKALGMFYENKEYDINKTTTQNDDVNLAPTNNQNGHDRRGRKDSTTHNSLSNDRHSLDKNSDNEVNNDQGSNNNDDNDDGLEAFLDFCDNEVDDDDSDCDYFVDQIDNYDATEEFRSTYNEKDEIGRNDSHSGHYSSLSSSSTLNKETSAKEDLHAIDGLIERLRKLKMGYINNPFFDINTNDPKNNDHIVDTSRDDTEQQQPASASVTTPITTPLTQTERYCAILVHSELQTIHFYICVAEIIRARLSSSRSVESSQLMTITITTMDKFQFDNYELTQKQIHDVVNVFFTIRYPHLLK